MLYDTLIGPFIEFEFMRRALAGVVALSLAGAPIGVFEFTSRAPRAPLAMARAALRVWARTPLDLPRTPTRLLLSFVVPLVPWIYFVDASVSHWRTYTPDELRAMTTRLGGQRYRWECGRARGVTFLIGTPTGP